MSDQPDQLSRIEAAISQINTRLDKGSERMLPFGDGHKDAKLL